MQVSWLAPVSFLVIVSAYTGANPRPQEPVTALPLAQQSEKALSGSLGIQDVTLSGTGVRTSGPDSETGNFTLQASSGGLSRFDFTAAGGTRSEGFNVSSGGTPQGFWTGTDSVSHPMAFHNTLAGAVWFFPALSILSTASSAPALVSYVGAETKLGISVQHIRIAAQNATVTASEYAMLQQFSSTDFYLDSSTLLPVAMVYRMHPDNDQNTDIIVEVDYSDYQTVRGVFVPFHIQKFLNGGLCWDLTVNSAAINTGLASSVFASN